MANVTDASLVPIYNRLNGAPTYHPFEANTFADPSIEAGDVVRVSRDGVNYDSPVHSTKMTWKKFTQVQMSSTGNEKRETVSRVSQRKYRGGSSGLRNSHYQHIYVEDAYNQLKSGLELTTSAARLYVEDAYNQMRSGLDLASSSAHLYVEDAYNQMKAGLDLTTSTAHLYVENAYNQMQAGLALTSSSSTLYAYNRTTRAAIIARINANGESEANIEADKVNISGTTTINDTFEVTSTGYLNVKKTMYCGGNVVMSSDDTYFSGDEFDGKEFVVKQAGNVLNKYTVDYATLGSMIKTASKTGNTLTLTRFDGTTETFSKAVALTGAWSSGTYTVSATSGSISGTVPSEAVVIGFSNPASNTYYVDVNATDQSGTTRTVKQTQYKLATSGSGTSTKVQIQNTSDERIANTPELSVGSLYSSGQNNVAINKGTWANGQVQFTKSAGTASTKGVRVGLSGSWDGNVYSYSIKDYYDNSAGVSTGYSGQITAPSQTDSSCAITFSGTGSTATSFTVNASSNYSGSDYKMIYLEASGSRVYATINNWYGHTNYSVLGSCAVSVSHSPTATVQTGWTGSISGRTSLGSASATSLKNTYILIDAKCGGYTSYYYLTIN